MKQTDARHGTAAEGNTRREQVACASPAAYDKLKGQIFDQAISERTGNRANLDALADYSLARMEEPVVTGWDSGLDVTHCRGHFILEVPPGAERGFAGQRHLQADVVYTAQAAADGNGFVYRLAGAEPIVAKLAAFNMTSVGYRPPPAIDEAQAPVDVPDATRVAASPVASSPSPERPSGDAYQGQGRDAPPPDYAAPGAPERVGRELGSTAPKLPAADDGEAAVRAFYRALSAGDGASASARVIPEKRSQGAFSPAALSRFYSSLPEPIRLTGIEQVASDMYRVSYRYSAGRSRCDGGAVVSIASVSGRSLIRSIRALNGC